MKNLLIVSLLVLICGGAFAQVKLTDEKRKEFEAQKVAFFTQELDLTPTEAAIFWPLYNEMRKKTEQIENNIRKRNQAIRDTKGLKEANYRDAVNKNLADDQTITTTKSTYLHKMLEVLPASKVWKLEIAERKFHRQLFDKLRRDSHTKK